MKKKNPEPPTVPGTIFNIYPKKPKRGAFALVLVYKTRSDMIKSAKYYGVSGDGFAACTQGVENYHSSGRKGNCFAWLFLNEKCLNEEVLAHECGHVAFRYCEFKKIAFADEENFCYPLGELFRQLFDGLVKHKIIKPN